MLSYSVQKKIGISFGRRSVATYINVILRIQYRIYNNRIVITNICVSPLYNYLIPVLLTSQIKLNKLFTKLKTLLWLLLCKILWVGRAISLASPLFSLTILSTIYQLESIEVVITIQCTLVKQSHTYQSSDLDEKFDKSF